MNCWAGGGAGFPYAQYMVEKGGSLTEDNFFEPLLCHAALKDAHSDALPTQEESWRITKSEPMLCMLSRPYSTASWQLQSDTCRNVLRFWNMLRLAPRTYGSPTWSRESCRCRARNISSPIGWRNLHEFLNTWLWVINTPLYTRFYFQHILTRMIWFRRAGSVRRNSTEQRLIVENPALHQL